MPEFWSSLVVLVLLCASAAVGFYVRPRLSETHISAESTDLIRLIVGMLVTFAALVLGLLTTSVKDAFDTATQHRGQFAAQLTELDQCLRNYGPLTEPIRRELQSYTAAVIISTWPSEPPPSGVNHPDTTGMPRVGESETLGRMLNQADLEIRRLPSTDAVQERLALDCSLDLRNLIKQRWVLIEEAHGSISQPFFRVLVFWLMVVFASFGLNARRNSMVLVAVAMCAICLTSAIFVILDMDLPYGGLFGISSQTMRDALSHMLE